MKLLIIGGMHGNEPLGIEVVKLLEQKPLANVAVVIANERAIQANTRFTKEDLNRSFPGGKGNSYEQKRAKEIVSLCQDFDFVFDFHNTHVLYNDCTFIGKTANQNLYAVASFFGLTKVVVADYDCLNKYAANCISIEISLQSKNNNALLWYKRIKRFAKQTELPKPKKMSKYRFVKRISVEEKIQFHLPEKKLRSFRKIEKRLAKNLGVQSPAYPIFAGDSYTPYNYGGLLSKIDEE